MLIWAHLVMKTRLVLENLIVKILTRGCDSNSCGLSFLTLCCCEIALKNFHIFDGDVEDSIRTGKMGDIYFDFNALDAYDKYRFALIKAAVSL